MAEWSLDKAFTKVRFLHKLPVDFILRLGYYLTMIEITDIETKYEFPAAFRWIGPGESRLVVLFFDKVRGVCIRSDYLTISGKIQEWISCDDKDWLRVSVTIK